MSVYGVGNDIVECLRIHQMIERHGESFLRRVYTQREIEFCSARVRHAQHYAARWAGKRAVLRAIGATLGGMSDWRDVELRPGDSGEQLTVAFAGEPRDLCAKHRIHEVHISVAQCRTHASAYAVAMQIEMDEFL